MLTKIKIKIIILISSTSIYAQQIGNLYNGQIIYKIDNMFIYTVDCNDYINDVNLVNMENAMVNAENYQQITSFEDFFDIIQVRHILINNDQFEDFTFDVRYWTSDVFGSYNYNQENVHHACLFSQDGNIHLEFLNNYKYKVGKLRFVSQYYLDMYVPSVESDFSSEHTLDSDLGPNPIHEWDYNDEVNYYHYDPYVNWCWDHFLLDHFQNYYGDPQNNTEHNSQYFYQQIVSDALPPGYHQSVHNQISDFNQTLGLTNHNYEPESYIFSHDSSHHVYAQINSHYIHMIQDIRVKYTIRNKNHHRCLW